MRKVLVLIIVFTIILSGCSFFDNDSIGDNYFKKMKWEETTDKDIYKIKGNPLAESPISYIEKFEDLQIGISYEMYWDGFLFWGKDKIRKIEIVPLTERSINDEGISKEEFELFSKIAFVEAGKKEMKKQEIGFGEDKLIIESAEYNDSLIKLTYGFMDDRVAATIEIEPSKR